MLSACTPPQWDQTDSRCDWYLLRLLPVSVDDDGIIGMMKQELAAYKGVTENVPRPGARPNGMRWRLREGLPPWKWAAKIMMARLPSSGDAECIFSLTSVAFSAQHERVLKTSWRWHRCFSSTESQQPRAAVTSQSSAVMATHQLLISNLDPFQGVCLDAYCGWDSTVLKPNISQPQSATKQMNYSNME